ncbi:MAG: hypothetical protein JXR13_08405, partial [Thalassovita sp.]
KRCAQILSILLRWPSPTLGGGHALEELKSTGFVMSSLIGISQFSVNVSSVYRDFDRTKGDDMFSVFKRKIGLFARDSAGAVTVEWIVLTAAICGFGLGAVNLIFAGPDNVAEVTNTALASSIDSASTVAN